MADRLRPSSEEASREHAGGTGQSSTDARESFVLSRIEHWDAAARRMLCRRGWGGYYHQRLQEVYSHLAPRGGRVLELGCGQGDLLAALRPSLGVGIDFSKEMLQQAAARHPDLRFVCADAQEWTPRNAFDTVILSDLANDAWDVQALLERARQSCGPQTRLLINTYSRLWELPLSLAQRMGLATSNLPQNWLAPEDVENLLGLAGFEVVRRWVEIFCPLPVPLLGRLMNRYLVKVWPFSLFALTHLFVARRKPQTRPEGAPPSVSVVVPVRNEEGNIPSIFDGVPQMGAGTELVFVEGGSTDRTFEAIEAAQAAHPEYRCVLLRQRGQGKGDAVREGFGRATGEVLMILDGDLTVPPEDLPRFYEALVRGIGEFVNGVRLVYPMEDQAMRFANLVANKCFSLAFSWLLGQDVKDTLCGTKVLWRRDYEKLAANRADFGDFDPFGDFDLLFGAAKLNLKIVDIPIRYRERTYGTTNIQRWRHGWMLLKMVLFASRKIKFV